ncbi:MAG: COX15/CtaA family protein [Gammaproteobacteria bacterium]|nr:COX15/CtaA family protein [Gammaproteobacteria bacterium]
MNPDTYPAAALLRYRRIATATLLAVYFLILVGASVRASGAGMGCPDWPTCFGQWIPPTTENQLPSNYQEIYADLGYAETRFNAVKTWIEYINRLIGVTIGILIFATAILSWPLRRYSLSLAIASFAAFLMVGLQGWLGARVVSSNLQPGMITLHMLMALAIVGTLLFALSQSRRQIMAAQPVLGIDSRFPVWLAIVLCLTVIQVIMGTQVREMTDILSRLQGEQSRSLWIEAMPWFFYVHRSFSALVLLANVWLAWLLVRSLGWLHTLTRLTLTMLAVIGISVLSGATLGHLGMARLVPPLHLVAATSLFGLQFLIWMSYLHSRNSLIHSRGYIA